MHRPDRQQALHGCRPFGLDAASGVCDALARSGRGFKVGDATVPIVPAAILFDLSNGGEKDWSVNPYKPLGCSALENASRDFELGSFGAGTGATTKDLKGGLGSASLVLGTGITVGALVAVNAAGSVVHQGQKHFWAAPFEIGDEFGGAGPALTFEPLNEHYTKGSAIPGTNTTIAIVATDARLTQAEATRLAIAAHDGMARAIVPSHTLFDGDLIFTAATGEKFLTDPHEDLMALGHAAAACLTRAIARGVYSASASSGDTVPTWSEKWGRA
jgi:D-aminopeptidase